MGIIRRVLHNAWHNMKEVLITDFDNTLYDWNKYFAPAFRAMVHALSAKMELDEDRLYKEFAEIYRRHESLEYNFAIQELTSTINVSSEQMHALIKAGRGAFNMVKRKRLAPYPHVRETLQWVQRQGIQIIGVTNSPVWTAQQRIYDLGIDGLINGLLAWKGPNITEDSKLYSSGYISFSSTIRKKSRVPLELVETMESDQRKPSIYAYQHVIDQFNLEPSNCWVIGDSLEKDLKPAGSIGMHTIYARYGKYCDQKDMDTLLKITHWSAPQITRHYTQATFEPEYTVDSFAELENILPLHQPTLF